MRTLAPVLLILAACRPDPGTPSYPDPSSSGDDTGSEALPEGPDPYEEGEERLSLGLYYESGYSELVEINDLDTHYYIYSDTYTEGVDLNDVVEGRESAVIEHGVAGWFGGGLTWDNPADLSDWTTLYVSLRSFDESFASFEVLVTGGGSEARVDVTAYGYAADGEWHHLAIPLADFATGGADMSAVSQPFVLIGEGGTEGDELKVDNLYITKD